MRLALTNSINRYAGGTWTPARLSSLLGWYRNNTDILKTGPAPAANGDDVIQWSDQSGNDNHATSSGNYFHFDSATGGLISEEGVNSDLHIPQLNFAGEFSMYMKVKLLTISGSSTDLFFYDDDTASQDFFRVQSATEIRGKINNSTKIGFSAGIDTGTFLNIGIERNSSNRVDMFLNGAPQTQIGTSGYHVGVLSGTLDIDSIAGNLDGIIAEVVITGKGLSASERTNLNNYLTAI